MGYHTHRPPTRSLVQRSQPGPIPYGVDGGRRISYTQTTYPESCPTTSAWSCPLWSRRGPWGIIHTDHLPGILSNDLSLVLSLMEQTGAVGYHTHRPPTRNLVQRSELGPVSNGVDWGRGVSHTQTTYPVSCPTTSAWSCPLWSRRGPWGACWRGTLSLACRLRAQAR